MKNKILLAVVLFLSVILGIVLTSTKKTNFVIPIPEENGEEPIKIRLLEESTGNIREENLEDYIVGVVSAEMPASFEIEALKAQAVAARTYAINKRNMRTNLDYDLIIGVKDQAYKDNQTLLKQWGIHFFQNYLKIRDAVEKTKREIVTYDGQAINAFYFSMSNGFTENVELVFKQDLPYLNSVDSKWDNDSLANYEVTKTIAKEDFCDKLNLSCDEIKIENLVRSDSNRVLTVTINGVDFVGTEIRTKLGLRSTDFNIEIFDSEIEITTKGYGHGVGMSQYGANGMAKDGYSYNQILKHYYQNTEIEKIKV